MKRPPRSLSREEILKAGLSIARSDDLRNLTMKRLGDDLGVTGMALYRHFANKGELVDAILDHFVHDADVAGHGTDPKRWRLWLRRTFAAQYRALAEAPGLLPFVTASESWRFGPAAMAIHDETLAVLRQAGFRRRDATQIYTAATALTVGWAALGGGAGSGAFESALARILEAWEV